MGTSVITKETTVQGSIVGTMNLHIAGTVLGSIDVEGLVVIEEMALVTGDVDADEVWVAGAIEGDIRATNSVNLRETARVEGDVISSSVNIEPGATLRAVNSNADDYVEAETVDPPIVDVVSQRPASVIGDRFRSNDAAYGQRRRTVAIRKKRGS